MITGKTVLPGAHLEPFIDGLRIAFSFSLILFLLAAWASWLRGPATPAEGAEGEVSESVEEVVLA